MQREFFKCAKCGKIIEVINNSPVPTICCGEEMQELKANSSDAALEKHVPVIETCDNLVTIKVGSTLHPMEEAHSIKWVRVVTNQRQLHYDLGPNKEPVVKFTKDSLEEILEVYAYCDLHGLWKNA